MDAEFSVENHVVANPKSWSRIDENLNDEHNCVFLYISYYERKVFLWVLKPNGDIFFRCSEEVDDKTLMLEGAYNLNTFFDKSMNGSKDLERILNICSKLIIAPVADLLAEAEIIIVPERSLHRVPFAALRFPPNEKYLSETFRIRIIPSLMTLKLIQDVPADYQTGALVVGDPGKITVLYKDRRQTIKALPGARREAEMIGQLLGVQPLLGKNATKGAVLQVMGQLSLIHIASHGCETGEVVLFPSATAKIIPDEEDYLLRISDILQVKLRANLVVLSSCHSGRGEIKAEGVLGIARAFFESSARSVLVTLWALEDEATERFMSHFYRLLIDGFSASECLHQAMKWMRNIGFAKVSQWAPFRLIGDNVKLDVKK